MKTKYVNLTANHILAAVLSTRDEVYAPYLMLYVEQIKKHFYMHFSQQNKFPEYRYDEFLIASLKSPDVFSFDENSNKYKKLQDYNLIDFLQGLDKRVLSTVLDLDFAYKKTDEYKVYSARKKSDNLMAEVATLESEISHLKATIEYVNTNGEKDLAHLKSLLSEKKQEADKASENVVSALKNTVKHSEKRTVQICNDTIKKVENRADIVEKFQPDLLMVKAYMDKVNQK